MNETAQALNIFETTLRRRLKSEEFPEYQVLNFRFYSSQLPQSCC